MSNIFLKKINDGLDSFKIDFKSKSICVCLSGGADSCALLNAVLLLQKKYLYSVSALHVNHLIRGEESYRDENFCKSLCENLNVDLIIERVDVPFLSEKRKKRT